MTIRTAFRLFLFGSLCWLPCGAALAAQNADSASKNKDAELQYVVFLSRHGVRAPMIKPSEYDKYSASPWSQWDVAPAQLTAHGYKLIKLFGDWDRIDLLGKGLIAPSGCGDAAHFSVVADSDQRTRETGKALAAGILPGCTVPIQALPVGTWDPLFNVPKGSVNQADRELAAAAVAGRLGGNVNNLTEAYRPELVALERVLTGCGKTTQTNSKRVSLFDVPSRLAPGSGDDLISLRGPVPTASSLAANLLLEYAQGMSAADTGWGCIDGASIRTLMRLNDAGWDYGYRTPAIARVYASNLIDHIQKSMEQSVTGKPVQGALGKPDDRLLIVVGHDSNIAAVAGSLGLNWIIDGRDTDTPPGGALIFELWRSRSDGKQFVRLRYIAQTLEQMREEQTLSVTNPPAQAPIFVPGCGRKDMSCTWDSFSAVMHRAVNPVFVSK